MKMHISDQEARQKIPKTAYALQKGNADGHDQVNQLKTDGIKKYVTFQQESYSNGHIQGLH